MANLTFAQELRNRSSSAERHRRMSLYVRDLGAESEGSLLSQLQEFKVSQNIRKVVSVLEDVS